MKDRSIIVFSGPTAVGKTATSIQMAQKFNGEIVNFDSLLFYRELNIGTAKPSEQEKNNIPHHMIDIVSAKTPLNAADYVKMALPIIHKIHQNNKLVILVGGSGFYLRALLKGMYPSTTPDEKIIQSSNELYQREGISPFLDILKSTDPETYNKLHPNDHYRIKRALEHYWSTEVPFSQAKKELEEKKGPSPIKRFSWSVLHLYLDIEKTLHWQLIAQRTKKMVNRGLVKEVEQLLSSGFSGHEKPLQSIGYKEAQQYLRGEFSGPEEFEEKITIATRQLAKAQRTWFNKVKKECFSPLDQQEEIEKRIDHFLEEI